MFGPALSREIRRHRKPLSTTWLVDETYVKILGKWHYRHRGVDHHGQVLDCWLSRTRDLPAAEAFFRRSLSSTGCTPDHVVTDKATFYPSAICTYAPGGKHTATGFCNLVISTNRCERNHGYVKSRIRPMRGLKSFDCATRLFPTLDALQLIERDFVRVPPIGAPYTGGRSNVRARHIAAVITRLGRSF
jgi:transposase-like protein